jgi:hypothetical protein
LAVMLACVGINVGVEPGSATSVAGADTSLIHLEDGVIEVQDSEGDWTPVAGDSAFDVTAPLESTDPWKVAGTTLETNESTRIEEGLQVGDLVRVQGAILEDGTWLATSIERSQEQIDPIIILIGRVDSVPDGTWEVLSITPLGEFEEDSDCGTVVATVVSVEGNVIQLAGWPVITLGEDVRIEDEVGGEMTLSPNQTILLVICPSGEGQIVIVQIIVLVIDDDETPDQGGEKVLICHKPDKKGGHTLSISSSAVPAHLGHGDKLGPCP